ncbi:SH3 domain-containing protein [Aspergillus fischeri NRRL 181]|uniref:SH3 domain protein, putative n=1 Tax=Neosartorya fischeri (strain ATCC 1020 / DSM 3700 / CBS 544.65 / FGSC A1164 / JCM 1740 / NRRL 181 / WB 181) TaxID=331117 RepID=A1D2M9_NEOFI|nr:SH3 domain protein, putative [Aspergillus fischeri NRRL 181]EAW22672.1 SH3 domain protein, putative [Aspergillus fischeri NRRL 181]
MTRPRIIRAGIGLAPHQEHTLRHADQDARNEMIHGPNLDESHLDADHYHDGMDIHDDMDVADAGLGHHGRGHSSEEGDLADEESDDLLDDDLMDKISSSPSIDDEDIDFEFVYALHNFVATVDGQANAAKGDTMVLLDDSNSYWWLVRIVKDGSIGYLPAEHIETPTERLARLNKHRNVDLSATMLGDNSEKSKNPLKKAMRRRNAKNVTFTAPTYIEASDIDWSTEDEIDDGDSLIDAGEIIRDGDDLQDDHNDDIVVEPLRPKSNRDKATDESENVEETSQSGSTSPEKQRSSQELFEAASEPTVSRSRNGTVRNTDSFFKDDTVETKKISLTPNLLRDEVSSGGFSSETKEGRGSFDNIDKALGANDKGRDDKKRKDKKPGMLSGLFKRKDKRSKSTEDESEEPEKVSGELSRTSPIPKTSSESVSSPESRPAKGNPAQKQTTKSQKQTLPVTSPAKQAVQHGSNAPLAVESGEKVLTKGKQKTDTIRQVVSEDDDILPQPTRAMVSEDAGDGILSLVDTIDPSAKRDPEDVMARDATSDRVESQHEERQSPYDRIVPLQPSVTSQPQRSPQKQENSYLDRRPESPASVSAVEAGAPPGLQTDVSSPKDYSVSPISPPISPDGNASESKGIDTVASPMDRLSAETPTWSDASLRSYLDDENDIRDLYIIVHDSSNIPPAGPEHPITGSLFKEESRRLKEMSSQLDMMLADWVGRRLRNATATKAVSVTAL